MTEQDDITRRRAAGSAVQADPKTLVADTRRAAPPSPSSPEEPLTDEGGYAARYAPRGTLGAGGMGEIKLAHDEVIGRDVAIKVLDPMLQVQPGAVQRFIREAQIQGQLEHPSIVPVHDLGFAPDGRAYFTMKRIRGRTLEAVIEGLREGRDEIVRSYSRRKLLTAFTSVCLAVELAHRRGILHRDLKPANVMLGDFGEVYVLDWGIARVLDRDDVDHDAPSRGRVVTGSPEVSPTVAGVMVGTPGYMAPEQVRGDIADLDPRTDVYGLGAVLFEILTYARLHEGESIPAILSSTLTDANAKASQRAPDADVPPELEAACVRATMTRREDRFATARELSDAVERYLDGARDLELRRHLADDHARAAERLAEQALSRAGTVDARRLALAEAGQALGLDPTHGAAKTTVLRLLTTPPDEAPDEVARELDRTILQTQRLSSNAGAVAFAIWVASSPPLGLWMGIRSLTLFAVFLALQILATASCIWAGRSRKVAGPANIASTVAVLLANGALNLAFGPLVVLPTVIAATMGTILLHPRLPYRALVLLVTSLIVAGPCLLEALGAWPAAYEFEGGRMILAPRMLFFPKAATLTVMVFASLATFAMLAFAISRVRLMLTEAERTVQLQAWQLRQLLPAQERAS